MWEKIESQSRARIRIDLLTGDIPATRGDVLGLVNHAHKKINAKPKSFSRIENMVNSMLVNPIASFGAAFSRNVATESGKCNTCNKVLDLAIV